MHISLAALALSSALSVNAAGFKLPRSFTKVAPREPSPLVSAAASIWRRQGDPQVDPVVDPGVICPGFAQNGGNNDGQVPSQTSTNNFANFCLTQNVELTDGIQKAQGSCNPTTVGRIIANNLMPRSKFVFPPNLDDSIIENTAFTIQMKIENMITGNFVNPATNYYAAPQQVDPNTGIVLGHSHVVIQVLPNGFGTAEPLDPTLFTFFKGLNAAADGDGILFADVVGRNGELGLPAGQYRMCSINSSSNHQPVLVARAQHGHLDDCTYFTVRAAGDQGQGNQGDQGQGNQGDQGQGNQGDQGQGNQGDQGQGNQGQDAGVIEDGNNQNQGQDGQNQGQDQNQNQGQDGQNQGQDQNQNQGQDGQNQGQDGQNQGQDGQNQGQDGQNQGQDQNNNNNNAGGDNLQTFTGTLGAPAPPVTAQGNQFQTNGQTLPTLITAIEASCNAQRNTCADASNASGGQFTIPQCDDQRTQCLAQNTPGDLDTNANLNTFTETINQGAPVAINPLDGGRCFTDGIELPNLQACVQRACDAQRNRCADSANGNIGPCDQARGRCLQQQPAARRA